jgi:hypothetical protein
MSKVITLIALMCLLTSCQKENDSLVNSDKSVGQKQDQELKDETKRMVHRLDRLIQSIDPMTGMFMNEERLKIMEQSLGQQTDIASHISLAIENLRAGESQKAADKFLYLLDHVKNKKLRRDIKSYLAISLMRVGEQANCINLHGSSSCIFPINKEAVHINKEGSTKAIQILSEMLNENPDDLVSQWLINIAYQTIGEHPDQIPSQWLINESKFKRDLSLKPFINIGPGSKTAEIDLAGGSVMDDFNGDGRLDIVSSGWGFHSGVSLFVNQGEGTFVNKTESAGLSQLMGGLNLSHADYDNDGDLDILVLRGAWNGSHGRIPNSLLQNNGDGVFVDVTESSGILSFHPTQVGVWADYNNDGWIDLYIGNENRSNDKSHPAELYHNNGDGTFTDVAKDVGLNTLGFVKGAAWGDYNNDGRPDLYVSNMGENNQLFENQMVNGTIQFKDVAVNLNLTRPIYSFPTWFWDYNNDGFEDIFVADFSPTAFMPDQNISMGEFQTHQYLLDYLKLKKPSVSSRLYKNNGDGTFTDVSHDSGMDRNLLAMGANYGDIDNDGFEDAYIGTGAPDFRAIIPNRMFKNQSGSHFVDVTLDSKTGHLQKGHGVSFGDYDNDGDQDIYTVIGGAYSGDFFQNALFQNQNQSNHWITIKLIGKGVNSFAIGSKVRLIINDNGKVREIFRTVSSGGSFGSNSYQLEIGLGQAKQIEELQVYWGGSGKPVIFENIQPNQRIKIHQGESSISSF